MKVWRDDLERNREVCTITLRMQDLYNKWHGSQSQFQNYYALGNDVCLTMESFGELLQLQKQINEFVDYMQGQFEGETYVQYLERKGEG